jgi:salicylate biosynthesis isochorismate synthase
MLFSRSLIAELTDRLEGEGLRQASVPCEVDPLDLVRAGSASFADATYYRSPDGIEIGALGTARREIASGPDRFERLARAASSAGPSPYLVGFSFSPDGPQRPEWDGFGAAEAVLPNVSLIRRGDSTELCVVVADGLDGAELMASLALLTEPAPAVPPEASDHAVEAVPGPGEWRDVVADCVAIIRSGAFAKVVLARSVAVTAAQPVAAFDVVAELRLRYPQCYIYGWQRGDAVLVGASPELLVARKERQVRSMLLAGSAPRGENDGDDQARGQALMASAKDRSEHRLVVDDVTERLAAVASDVVVAPIALRRMPTVQHLATEVSAATREDVPVLEIVDRLHPTPAVGGTPRDQALAYIDKVEGIDRGWYSGGIGWFEANGNGEVAVALRCALIRGDHALVFAGNGIVADSDPTAELAETRLKLRPLLELLTAP